jgi:integrase
MIRKILVSLGSLLGDAQERGLVARNVVRDIRGRRKGTDSRQEKRQKGRLKVGVDIPTRAEIKAIVEALTGRWRPLLLTAIFSGLRASELRGLRWRDVDFDKREIRVHQRADRFNKIGPPKSISGERTVPVPPLVVNALKSWFLACPKGELGLVFPNGSGNVEQLPNIVRQGLMPTQIRAGVATDTGKRDEQGAPILRAKISGHPCPEAFLCLVAHKSRGGRRAWSAGKDRPGAPRAFLNHDDDGRLRPSVPTWRRCRRIGGG